MENVMIKPGIFIETWFSVIYVLTQAACVYTKQQQGLSFPHKYLIPVLLTCGKILLQTSSKTLLKFRFFFHSTTIEKHFIFWICWTCSCKQNAWPYLGALYDLAIFSSFEADTSSLWRFLTDVAKYSRCNNAHLMEIMCCCW